MAKGKVVNKNLKKERALTQLNKSRRASLYTAVKKVVAAVEGKDQEKAQTALKQALPIIDKMRSKGIIHDNTAARHKSRLTKKVAALAAVAAS